MKSNIRIESFEEMRARKLARAKKLDRGMKVPAERSISFESAEQMAACLTRERIRLCQVARERAYSVTELAAALKRNRRAVARDVGFLAGCGLLHLNKKVNPGHGVLQIVEPVARKFKLQATI